jgi:hypothetical protein
MAQNFIGSRISLISKSDVCPFYPSYVHVKHILKSPPFSICEQIRYRGILHSIDTQEATVSLERGPFFCLVRFLVWLLLVVSVVCVFSLPFD